MDYSNCTVMFTTEQSNYMNTILSGVRSSLMLSPGCDPAGPPNCAFNSSPAGPGPVVIATNGTVVFLDASLGVPTGWTWTISGTEGVDWDYTGGTTTNSQNPQVTFYNVGNYTISLVASNGFGNCTGVTEVNYVNVVAPTVGTDCDTLRNWDPADADANGYFVYNPAVGGSGQFPGHYDFDGTPDNALQICESFNYVGTAEVRRIRFPVFVANSGTGAATVDFNVYAGGATPGAILATETVDIADLNTGAWNEVDFTTPASVTGQFYVGVALDYTSTDEVLMGMTATITGGDDNVWVDWSTSGWAQDIGPGSWALDVMLSNGPVPVADFQFDGAQVCPGGDIVVNGSGSTNTTDYYWYQTDDPYTTTISSNFTAGTTFNFPGPTGNYSIYLFADGSCMTDALVLPVVVAPAVTAGVTITHTTCGNNDGGVTITGAAGGDGNYTYSLDGVNYQASATFSNLPSGTYTAYILSNGDACEGQIGFTVNASTPLSGSVSPSAQGICPGGTAAITASGGTGYTWYDGATIVGTTAAFNPSPTVQTQYSCEITDGTCTDIQYSTVNVYALPTVDAGTDQTICAGTSATLSGSGAVSYSWDNSVTNGVAFSPASTDTYTVTGTDANGCVNTDDVIVTVSAAPTTSNLAETCNGGNTAYVVTFDIAGGLAPYVVTGGAGSLAGSTWTSSSILSGVSYSFTVTDFNGCVAAIVSGVQNCACTTNSGTMVTSPSLTICGTGAATATHNSDETFDIDDVMEFYLHDGSGPALGTSFGTNGTPTFSFVGGMVYGTTYYISSVVGNDAGGGVVDLADPCLSVATGTPVVWYDLPSVDAGSAQNACTGTLVTLSGSGAVSYSWDNSVVDGVAFTATSTNTYNVIGTDANGCTNTDNVTVTVLASPAIGGGADQSICPGTSVTLSGTGGVSYVWDNSVVDGVAFTPGSTTIYTVTGTDGNGCENTDLVTITVQSLPSVDAGVDQTVCAGSDVTLSGSGATSYVWDNAVTDGVVFNPTATATYTVIGTDGNGCTNTDIVDVTVTTGQTISGVVTHDDGTTNGAIDVTITGGTPPYTISWDNSETTEDITGLTAGDYTITVTDDNGCVVPMTFTVLSTVGIGANIAEELTIYPNPTSGIVNIKLEGDFAFTILDARGRLIISQSTSDNSTVDLSSFESGVYFVRIQRDNESVVRKIILK
jgi:hypothetical protein